MAIKPKAVRLVSKSDPYDHCLIEESVAYDWGDYLKWHKNQLSQDFSCFPVVSLGSPSAMQTD